VVLQRACCSIGTGDDARDRGSATVGDSTTDSRMRRVTTSPRAPKPRDVVGDRVGTLDHQHLEPGADRAARQRALAVRPVLYGMKEALLRRVAGAKC